MTKQLFMALVAGTCLVSLPAFAAEAVTDGKPVAAVKVDAATGERPFIPKEQWDKLPQAEKDKIKAERKAHWEKLSPEEKAKIKAERRAKWEKMPAEEKEKIKAERREKWEKLPPEEKEKRRAKMKEHYEQASPEEKEKIRARMDERKKEREEHAGDKKPADAAPAAGGKN